MSVSSDGIVGRDEELLRLVAFIDAVDELPGALVLEGEPGIGKTTLLRAGIEAARGRSFRVLACSPSEPEAKLSFAALRDLLVDVFPGVRRRLPVPQRRAVAAALLLEDSSRGSTDAGAVAAGVLGALRVLATESPVVVAVDDVQWLDRPSSRVLEFVARRAQAERLAFLVAWRVANSPVPLGLDRAFPEDRLRWVRLGPLDVDRLYVLLRDHLEVDFSRSLMRRICEASGGNPLLALEIARALERRGGRLPPGMPLPVPATLDGLVSERLAALPISARDVVLVAAALGRPTVGLVSSVAGRDAPAQLELAVAANVLELDGDRLRFTHPGLASAVYSAADASRLRRLHRRLGELVEEPEERARHLAIAAAEPSAEVAEALDEAAVRARARGASGAAAELAEQALYLTPEERADDALRRRINAAGHLFEAGDAKRAGQLLEEAVRVAPAGATRAEALLLQANVHAFGADLPGALRLYRRAIAEAGELPRIRAEAKVWLAVALVRMVDDLSSAAGHAKAAVALLASLEEPEQLPEYLLAQGFMEALRGRPEAVELLQRAGRLAEAAGEPSPGASSFLRALRGPGFLTAVLLMFFDRLEEARVGLEAVHVRALELGDESSLPVALRFLAYVAWLEGDWATALRQSDEGYAIAVQVGQPSLQASLAGTRAVVLAHLGRVEEARDLADEGLRLSRETGTRLAEVMSCSALGSLELSLGDAAGAHAVLGPLVARFERAGVREPGAGRFLPNEIEALIAIGRLDEAEVLLRKLERRARMLDRPSGLAASARCRGLLLSARDDHARALDSFARALVAHERVPMPFERARTLLALGVSERRAKRRLAARASLEQALASFEELGAVLWAGQARAELERIGGRIRSVGLTPTERRIAELVVEGRSNKEVAVVLHLTPKTVETALTRIYRKLGIHSRTALARSLAEGRGAEGSDADAVTKV